jgi:hypothetical protein
MNEIPKMVKELLGDYCSEDSFISHEEYLVLYDKVCAAVAPIVDSLSKDECIRTYEMISGFVADESIKAEKAKVNATIFVTALDIVAFYMRDTRPEINRRYDK